MTGFFPGGCFTACIQHMAPAVRYMCGCFGQQSGDYVAVLASSQQSGECVAVLASSQQSGECVAVLASSQQSGECVAVLASSQQSGECVAVLASSQQSGECVAILASSQQSGECVAVLASSQWGMVGLMGLGGRGAYNLSTQCCGSRTRGNASSPHPSRPALRQAPQPHDSLHACCKEVISQWAIFAIRILLEHNQENQEVVRALERRGVADDSALREMGFRLEERDGKLLLKPLNKDP
ncbi:hypothetical protein JZ751_004596 [Albula glossodonta]|uniref:Ataxin-10 domain-containing protein n=1 Tax=Albula glossodonta TaxID=121402 RepID=A0A8T2NG87_9TELE|nr:hypothetical protein JZ751_004596 [Albula glossodonta]